MATPRGDVTDGALLGTAGLLTKVQGTILGADRILVGSGDTIELRLKFSLSTGVGVKLFNDYNDKGVYNALDTLELVDELQAFLEDYEVPRDKLQQVVEDHQLVVEEDRISRRKSSELRGRDHRQFKSSGFAEAIDGLILAARQQRNETAVEEALKALGDKPSKEAIAQAEATLAVEPTVELAHVQSRVAGQVDYAG